MQGASRFAESTPGAGEKQGRGDVPPGSTRPASRFESHLKKGRPQGRPFAFYGGPPANEAPVRPARSRPAWPVLAPRPVRTPVPRHAERPSDLLDRLRLAAGVQAVMKCQYPPLLLRQLGQRTAECLPVQAQLGLLRGSRHEGRHQFTRTWRPHLRIGLSRLVTARPASRIAGELLGRETPGFAGDLFPRSAPQPSVRASFRLSPARPCAPRVEKVNRQPDRPR